MKYVLRNGRLLDPDGNEMELPERDGICCPTMISDTPGYFSVVSGKWVEGARERRDDLARTGCQPAEPRPDKDRFCTSKKWAEKLGLEHNNAPGAGRPKHWDKDFSSTRIDDGSRADAD